MTVLYMDGHRAHYEVQALCMLFLEGEPLDPVQGPPPEENLPARYIHTELYRDGDGVHLVTRVHLDGEHREARQTLDHGMVREEQARIERAFGAMLYLILAELTGLTPPWGLLTGVRPVKLFLKEMAAGKSEAEVKDHFCREMFVSREKADLAYETACVQQQLMDEPEGWTARRRAMRRVSLYLSIPFCPTRCRYCSFVSQTIERAGHLIEPYVRTLLSELETLGALAKEAELTVEEVYFGGGTPTTLSAEQLSLLLEAVHRNFAVLPGAEITVEAGRPDTITREKCEAMLRSGVTRISVNPQSLSNEVLRLAGRPHTAEQVRECWEMVRTMGFRTVNMDLIAGLEGDTSETFAASLQQVLDWGAENITVHVLALKRAAQLAERRQTLLRGSSGVSESISWACSALHGAGYRPYYLYRQKNMVENLENTGWSLPGHENLYNIRIMDESRTILSAGAGAVTKLVRPVVDTINTNEIERIFHYKYPYEYIDRFSGELGKLEKMKKFYGI